ncbi:ABC transporter permease [Microbacterium sp. EYE_5]|uniref:ABC transporter permease n=1 Tax=unclassified Microbacterium TaxID=2609290 RepID=UPI002004AD98|nr:MULTISPECIES: ABC transporter permease [unclassified Microbacterium]MCK6080212.1 ABC transporter permease [Microbacterium sp. EYE_382]MCK6085483.1 ABC transporter permease [Microbacterium sp. EYE_384]MCK6122292.1 ABC transporter permease [Microbacterium sp. EYE_80]MCK6126246.1 ABC transporter permease [Microbacterium sp. EYE_79]MCK6141167.1 ABC transporter permease [Microbacterium sp. EYE_39]
MSGTITTARPTGAASGAKTFVRSIATARESGIAVALIVVVIAATAANGNFLFSPDGFRDLLLTPSLLLLVAVGQAIVIITRNVDLSVGSTVGLTAYLTGRLFIDIEGAPVILVFVAGIVLGGILGAINGLLVAWAKVPALVITLGTMYIYRGINVAWAGSDRINASDLPREFRGLGTQQLIGIPVLTIIAVVVLIAAAWYLRNIRGGREFYAIGSDPAAAHLYGLKVNRRIISAFVVSGALSGLAGVLYAARYGTVSSAAGFGWELQAIGAAVIGGVAISGGVGTVWGAAIGAYLLLTINRALPILGIDDFWQRAVVGVLILGSIVLDRVLAVRQHRRLIAQREDDR